MKKTLSVLLSLFITFSCFGMPIEAQAAESVLAITPTTAYIQVNEKRTIKVTVNKKAVKADKCTFSSNNTNIATVSSGGVITAKKTGKAVITVKLKSDKKKVKKCTVIVKPQMTLSATSKTLYKGQNYHLTVKLSGKTLDDKKCTFTSSDKKIATVTSGGTIKAVKAGSCYITVKLKSDSKVYKKCKITVKNYIVQTDASALKFSKGGTRTMKCTLNGQNAGGGSLNYSSSDSSVATVNSNGVITAKSAGSAVITAKYKKDASAKATCRITVIAGNKFTVTNKDLPLNGYAMNFRAYNSTTRPFYMLNSYLRELEKLGGGTLTLTKGTYNISNVLYIPSNVTIQFNDGVVINKTDKTSASNLNPSGTLFMLCAPSVAESGKTYSAYNGVHDVKLIGKGNVTINMANAPANVGERCAFVLCHNKNISFENLKMTNQNGNGHFVELDASNNVTFTNCTFSNTQGKVGDPANECINLDIPDKNTGGFSQKWTSYDCTPNKTITIKNCIFDNVQTGIGTHSFTPEKYHTDITIDSCTFKNCIRYGIGTINWKNFKITNNTFDGMGMTTSGKPYLNGTTLDTIQSKCYGVYVVGSDKPTITNNKFSHTYYPMYFNCSFASTSSAYKGIYTFNTMTESDYKSIAEKNSVDASVDQGFAFVKVIYFGANKSDPKAAKSLPKYYYPSSL